MKKLIVFIVIAVLIVTIAFAGSGCKTVTSETAVVAETTAAAQTTEAAEETSAVTEAETVAESIFDENGDVDISKITGPIEGVEGKKVALLWLTTTCPYCTPCINEFTKWVELAGAKVTLYDAQVDVNLQSTQIDDALATNPDIINLVAVDSLAIMPAVKKAFEAGVPVIMDHTAVAKEDEKYTIAYAGPDTYLEGEIGAEFMHKALGGKGKVGIIEGIAGQEAQINRSKGFEDKLKELGSEIEIVAKQATQWDKATATKIMEDWLVRYPDIAGVFGQDDTLAVGAWVAAQEAGIEPGAIKLVGVGASKEGLELIQKGYMEGTVSQIPSNGGKKGAQVVIKALILGTKPPQQLDPYLNLMDLPIVDINNVEEFLPGEW